MTVLRRTLVLLMATVGCGACAREELVVARSLFSEADAVPRVRSSVRFDTLWSWGSPSDTLLAAPAFPRSDGSGGVVVLDLQTKMTHRFGADGSLVWSWGREGEGPGEVKNVRAMDVMEDGSVVLVDSGNQRIVELSADGVLVSEKPLRAAGAVVGSVAALSSGRLGFQASRPVWGVVEPTGAVQATELPENVGEPMSLQHQGLAARWRGDKWVFGFSVGNGWMVFDGQAVSGVYPYVEHSDFPDVRRETRLRGSYAQHVERPTTTGKSLSVVGDTLHVLFFGHGRREGRPGYKIDKYDIRTGSYLETDLLPHFANHVAVGKLGRVFTVLSSGYVPTIVALARRAAPAS